MSQKNKPQFPIYIPTKGRSESRLTVKALEQMNVPYCVVVEEQEYSDYAKVIDKKNILVLDKSYQENYNTCDDLGLSKSVGPGAARNFIWDHSISEGHKWHWVMDDNIKCFRRWHKNKRIKIFINDNRLLPTIFFNRICNFLYISFLSRIFFVRF